MVYYIHNVHECPCKFQTISFKGDKSCSLFHIRPSLSQYKHLIIQNGQVFHVVIHYFLKFAPIPPQCVSLYVILMDGHEPNDNWMLAWAS
jgi:hypothetical protein